MIIGPDRRVQMDWVLNLMKLWFGVSSLIIATGWYAALVVPQFWPDWWKRVVVDVDPNSRIIHKR